MELQAQKRADCQGSALRLVHGDGAVMHEGNTGSFSDSAVIDRNDPRWTMAALLQMRIQNHLRLHPLRGIESEHNEMVEQCVTNGFSPMHAQLLVQIVERACARGGLDGQSMGELLCLPMPERRLKGNHRAIVFGLLGVWALVIAGFVVTASRIMAMG